MVVCPPIWHCLCLYSLCNVQGADWNSQLKLGNQSFYGALACSVTCLFIHLCALYCLTGLAGMWIACNSAIKA